MIGKLVAVVALVTLPLSISLWHKSHNEPELYRYDVTLYKSLRVFLQNGVCSLRLLDLPTKTGTMGEFRAPLDYDPTPGKRSLMFSTEKRGQYRIIWLAFPLWLTTTLLTFCGTVPIARGPVRQWWRRAHGHCEECGYNLRGNRSGRCPECGTHTRRALQRAALRRGSRKRR